MLALLAGLAAGTAGAGSLAVSPLRLDIGPGQQMAALTVTNSGQEPMLVQAGVRRWQQQDSQDNYTIDDSMLITPAMFRLMPGGSQLVRVGWRRQAIIAGNEQAWRVFLDELPTAQAAAAPGLRVNLRIGVPLFVPPASAQAISWKPERDDDGKAFLRLSSNVHARITRLRLLDARHEPLAESTQLRYVLAGGQLSWPETGTPAASAVEVTTDAGRIAVDLARP